LRITPSHPKSTEFQYNFGNTIPTSDAEVTGVTANLLYGQGLIIIKRSNYSGLSVFFQQFQPVTDNGATSM
jgi:hypothetical protein